MPRRRKKLANASTSSRRKFRLNLSWLKAPDAFIMKRSMMALAWVGCIGGLAAGWILGVPQLHAFASQRGSVSPTSIVINYVNAPAWFNGDLKESLTRTAMMQIEGDPMKRDDLIAIRQSLLDTGWFDSIRQVRRRDPNVIEIDAAFVRPFTVIRDEEGDHLVDARGTLLPLKYDQGARTHFIAVTGAHFDRPQRVGQAWLGTDIQAAIKLLNVIDQQPWRKQIREIDVSAFHGGGPIKLRTDIGSSIIWGGPPGEEPALEVLAQGKLQRLNFLFERYQRIDGHHMGEIDLTGEKAVLAR